MFHWKNGIVLNAMHGNQASSPGRGSLMGFLELRKEPVVHYRVWRGCPFETRVCSAMSGHLSRYDRHIRNVN